MNSLCGLYLDTALIASNFTVSGKLTGKNLKGNAA